MLRTIVYNGPAQPRGNALRANGSAAEASPKDGYLEKLVKYVPAEILAVFVPLAAASGAQGVPSILQWVVFFVGLVGTAGWLGIHASKLSKTKRPRWYSYLIASMAFFFWAAASSDVVRNLLGLNAPTTEVLLGVAVLTIPAIDELFSIIYKAMKPAN